MSAAFVIHWFIFLGMSAFIIYPFTLYPLLLRLLSLFRSRTPKRHTIHPSVSILISAYNEERGIRDKLENTIALTYPRARELVEIIVVSDGSTDGTDRTLSEFESRVKVVRTRQREGKQMALNRIVELAKGEIFVFTDVSSLWRPDTLELLMSNFSDVEIGAVTTVPSLYSGNLATPRDLSNARNSDNGEAFYQGLDSRIRHLEGKVASCTGCWGTLYAVRRRFHEPFSPSDASDLASALNVVKKGARVIVDREVVGISRSTNSYRVEFSRKVRTIVGGMDTFWHSGVLRWGLRTPIFLWCLGSHKVVRWFSPVAALVAIGTVCSGTAFGVPLMRELALVVASVFTLGFTGVLFPRLFFGGPLRLVPFVLVSLVAGLYSWVEFLRGKKFVVWTPTVRERIEAPAPVKRTGTD